MGCSTCSNNKTGLPAGCKNNGACGVDGCNSKMDVFDWLKDVPLPEGQRAFDGIEVRFKNGRKGFYRNQNPFQLIQGEIVVVEASPGHDVGVVTATGEIARLQMIKKQVNPDDYNLRKVYRKANQSDVDRWHEARALEMDTMHKARFFAKELELDMKISDVEYQGDKTKAIFYYTADTRVDFRELIKKLADAFKIRIEMKQIGARQEAGRLGGIGSCGRELCCSTWLTDFRSVSTNAARYQQLSLNPQKLAGQCGKLKCCLNYELDMYIEAVKQLPSTNTKLEFEDGLAVHFKTDIFRKMLWFVYKDDFRFTPVPIPADKVFEIIEVNKKGIKPASIKSFMYFEDVKEVVADYDNVDGQDSLTRFDDRNKKKKKRKKKPGQQRTNNPKKS
jgi:cell fate regulator YaaT (PSP1 superfamily)